MMDLPLRVGALILAISSIKRKKTSLVDFSFLKEREFNFDLGSTATASLWKNSFSNSSLLLRNKN